MSPIPLGILSSSGGAAIKYFLSTFGLSVTDAGVDIALDSKDNSYLAISNNGLAIVAKFDPSGLIQWQRSITPFGIQGILVDGDDNIVISGGRPYGGFFVAKYDSNGTILWTRAMTDPNASGNPVWIGRADGGNFYLAWQTFIDYNSSKIAVAKYNSSGSIIWQTSYGARTNEANTLYGFRVDSSYNVYLLLYYQDLRTTVIKINSNNSFAWVRQLNSSTYFYGGPINVDSSGSVYVTGTHSVSTSLNWDAFISKLDASGSLVWSRRLSGAGSDGVSDVVTDSQNNVYIIGGTSSAGAGGSDGLIAKYDSNGTIVWQRTIGGSGTEELTKIRLDSKGNLRIIGRTDSAGAGSFDAFLVNLPSDGSLTGSYAVGGGNIVYSVSSLSDVSNSVSNSTTTNPINPSPQWYSTSQTFTEATTSLVQSITTI